MYINNLKRALNKMDEEAYKRFEGFVCDYHLKKMLRYGIRKIDIKKQIERFKDGQTSETSHNNLDAIFYALDMIYGDNGATDVLYGVEDGRSWRKVLGEVTSDMSIPSEVNISHLFEDNNLRILRSIIRNVLKLCASDEKEETSDNLRMVNQLLKLAVDK
jgi:hypothetical protein